MPCRLVNVLACSEVQSSSEVRKVTRDFAEWHIPPVETHATIGHVDAHAAFGMRKAVVGESVIARIEL